MKLITFACLCAFAAITCLSGCGSSGASYGPSLEAQVERAKRYPLSTAHSYEINGKSYAANEKADFSKYPVNQISNISIKINSVAGVMKLYQQPYSVVIATDFTSNSGVFQVQDYIGLETKLNDIPKTGTATYTGKAFDRSTDSGTLSYTVNFGTRTGSGSITNLTTNHGAGPIILNNASISGKTISGSATGSTLGSGDYELKFFGPNAEEIAGKVTNIGGSGITNNDIGFAGKK